MSLYFPKLLSFQANFGNFGIRLMKLGLFSRQFKNLKIWPMFIPVFALNKGSSLYQEFDLGPISAARPRIDLCTKNPPPGVLLPCILLIYHKHLPIGQPNYWTWPLPKSKWQENVQEADRTPCQDQESDPSGLLAGLVVGYWGSYHDNTMIVFLNNLPFSQQDQCEDGFC